MSGVWRTISGRRVFIEEGQSITDAIKQSKKFNNTADGIKINNISKHAKKRQTERNIKDEDIKNAIEHPIHTSKSNKDSYIKDKKYIGKYATVIVSEKTGDVITVYKTGRKILKKYGIK